MKTNIIRLKDCENSKKFANWCWQTSAVNTSINYFSNGSKKYNKESHVSRIRKNSL